MAEDGKGVAMVMGGVTEGKGGLASHLSLGKEKAEARQSAPTMGRGGTSELTAAALARRGRGTSGRLHLMLLALASERHYANRIKGGSLPSLSFVSPASTQGCGRVPHVSRLLSRKPAAH